MIYAVGFISLAFVLYTVGVWSEKLQGELRAWHVIMFWAGLVSDFMGTLSMEAIVRQNATGYRQESLHWLSLHMDFHTITGIVAVTLMILHAVWAQTVITKKKTVLIKKFHRYSLFVWILWLIPFVTGFMFHLL